MRTRLRRMRTKLLLMGAIALAAGAGVAAVVPANATTDPGLCEHFIEEYGRAFNEGRYQDGHDLGDIISGYGCL
jgi:hypothetical protein